MTRSAVATTAPIPRLRQLAGLLSPFSADDWELSGPWRQTENPTEESAFLFSRATWALRTVVHACSAARRKLPTIWLPDYFCNYATQPLRSMARLVFYPVDENLRPDWSMAEKLSGETPPDLFVLVHYFGFPSDARQARTFCDTRGAILIEDASHALMPSEMVGQFGDATLWSLYKHLPIPDGGLLTMRSGGPLDRSGVEAAFRALPAISASAGSWLAKRLVQILAPSIAVRLRAEPLPFGHDPAPETVAVRPRMSLMGRRLLAVAQRDIANIAARRRTNAAALFRTFDNVADLSPLFAIGDSWVPYRAVFRCARPETASLWYDRIHAVGCVAESWPDLPPEVLADPNRHAVAYRLRQTILTLPIHADRDADDLAAVYGLARNAAA